MHTLGSPVSCHVCRKKTYPGLLVGSLWLRLQLRSWQVQFRRKVYQNQPHTILHVCTPLQGSAHEGSIPARRKVES